MQNHSDSIGKMLLHAAAKWAVSLLIAGALLFGCYCLYTM